MVSCAKTLRESPNTRAVAKLRLDIGRCKMFIVMMLMKIQRSDFRSSISSSKVRKATVFEP